MRYVQLGIRRALITPPSFAKSNRNVTQRLRRLNNNVLQPTQTWTTPTRALQGFSEHRSLSTSCRLNHAPTGQEGEEVEQSSPTVPGPARVSIPIDGTDMQFSALLLRDACSCPLCVHEFTKQRLFSAADIPSSIQAREVRISTTNRQVLISWKNDVVGFDEEHQTKMDLAALKELSQTGASPSWRKESFGCPVLWTERKLDLPDYDYKTYMQDDRSLLQLMKQLHVYGLAFVTNIPKKESSLATIATRMGPIKDTFYGQTWDVRTVPQAINAAYTSSDLGFHTDLLYFQQPPHIQLLHCIQSASSGGASVFADAFKAAIDLFHTDVEAFETLATVPVNYHYDHPGSNVYRTTKPVIGLRPLKIGDTVYTSLSEYKQAWSAFSTKSGGPEWDDSMLGDCLDKINWGPPFLAPFSSHQKSTIDMEVKEDTLGRLNDKAERWHQAAVKFNALLQRDSYLFERKMNPGECVLFNNTRTLHSRRAFDSADIGKPRWLRGTYVDKDPFFSKMRVLKNKLE